MSDEEVAGKAVGLMLQGSAESNPGLSEDQRKARLALARAFSEGHGPEACDALSAQLQIEASNVTTNESPQVGVNTGGNHHTTETPSPVKRKATINSTRSDSEGEAPKRRRRVIEIESDDDDDDEAPRPTTTMPWETPEWQAHCAKSANRRSAAALTSLTRMNMEKSDEELWRDINDPVGAKRMQLTRMLAAERFARLRSTDYIEREVAKFARELEERRRDE